MHNLYASRVSAEHPIALWDLDGDANYVSLLNESDRDLTGWTVDGAAVTNHTGLIENCPFPESYKSEVVPASRNLLTHNQATADSTVNYIPSVATVTSSTDYAYEGTYSAKMVSTVSSGYPSIFMYGGSGAGNFPVVGNKTYTFMAHVLAPAITKNMYISIYWYSQSGGGGGLGSSSSSLALTNSWNARTLTATAPSGATFASMRIYWDTSSIGETVYVDRIGFYQADAGVEWDDPDAAPDGVNGDYTSTITSPDIWSDTNTYLDKPTAASFFIHLNDASIEYIDFGSTNGTLESYTRNYLPTTAVDTWVKISTSNIIYSKLFIRIKYYSGQSTEALTWHINGLTLGQYSEPFASSSFGVEPVTPAGTESVITSGALPNTVQWYEILSEGIESRSGYQVISNDRLLAQNTGMPMIFGSRSTLKLLPIDAPNEGDYPSLVFDGCGVMNELGKLDTYTVEFWLRISGSTTTPKKIFGPVGSNDGLYITSSTMTLVVGGNFATHNVGVMYNPMLIHLRVSEGFIGLVIDGDEVSGVNFDPTDITWPGVDEDWLGFWSYADLAPIELSCFSIFGYLVPTVVAKRRFVLGQGVPDIGLINSAQRGVTVFSDFSTSMAANSMAYPDTASWQQGHYNNLSIGNDKLSVPDLPLPEVIFSTKTKQQWYDDLAAVQGNDRFFTFRPTGWAGERAFARFDNLDQYVGSLSGIVVNWSAIDPGQSEFTYEEFDDLFDGDTYNDVSGTYATYLDLPDEPPPQPILTIRQKTRPTQMISMYTDLEKVYVKFIDNGVETTLLEEVITLDTRYVSYINFLGGTNKINDQVVPSGLREMLFNTDDLEILVGTDGVHIFAGNYYNLSLIDAQRAETANSLFDPSYFVDHAEYTANYNELNICSYTWLPKLEYGFFYEDIGIRGLWEDYVPVSLLAGTVYDEYGKQRLGIDTIQFNMGHVRPKDRIVGEPAWTYAELKALYGTENYSYLKEGSGTGYETYQELSTKADTSLNASFDTSAMFIKAYVAWQKTNRPIKSFSHLSSLNSIVPPSAGDVIYVQTMDNYIDVPIEVVDGQTIVVPKNRRPDQMALGIYVEFVVPGIRTYPVALKSLEIATFASDRNQFTPTGTKYGKDIYPFNYNGIYYDKMANNPFRLDKRGYPYLYLGRETGFIPDGVRQDGWDRGFQVTIPEGKDQTYSIDSLQLWIRRERSFNPVAEKVFELAFSNKKIKFYLEPYETDTDRTILRIYDQDDMPYSEVSCFQNGVLVNNPIISKNEWTALQFSFASGGLSMGGTTGRISLYPGLVYQNISYFAPKQSLGATRVIYRKWSEVDDYDWQTWTTSTWSEVLLLGSVVDKKQELSQIIYSTYTGQRAIEISGNEPLELQQGTIEMETDTRWVSNILIPS